MNYENQVCPGCGNPLRDGEDIVVCPVCATPQHRECWMKNGRCANDDLHASGFVWEREKTATATDNIPHEAENNSDARVCHVCCSENPADALHCGNCGALFGEQQAEARLRTCAYCGKVNSDDARHCNQCGAPLGAAYSGMPYVPGTNIAFDEKIGENTAGDLAGFVRVSANRYLPKFKKFESGRKFGFNFAAFFFAPYWFFYRKLYKAGAFFLVAFVTASILLSGFTNTIYNASVEYSEAVYALGIENATEEELLAMEDDMEKLMTDFYAKVKKPALISLSATAVLRLICALMADRLYYKKILKDMEELRAIVNDLQLKRMLMAGKGGLSTLAFAASLIGENLLVNAIVYAADFIKNII